LLKARALYLHIEGTDKRVVLEQAEQPGSSLPIASALHRAPQLEIYWCP
jgi:6-phosphogluconolactonase/glucosamine-6-phosphate isomerase/deaminase